MPYYMQDYSYYTTYGSDAVATGLWATIFAMLGFFLLIGTIVGVLLIIAMWKIFKKAGEEGWKSIIPVYNLVVLFKIAGLSPWLVLVYLLGGIPVIGGLIALGMTIYLSINVAKVFGKSTGFAIGLLLLSPIFYMILAFGDSVYVGKETANE
jgi:hypothetical protein